MQVRLGHHERPVARFDVKVKGSSALVSCVGVDATSAGLKTNRRRKLCALKKDEPAMRHGLLSSKAFEWLAEYAGLAAVTC